MNPQRRPQLRSRISDSGSTPSAPPKHRTRASSTANDTLLPADILGRSMDYKDTLPTYTSSSPGPSASPRRPLIDFVKNEWRTDHKYAYSTGNHEPDWLSMLKAPRFRRYAIVYLVILSTCWMAYKWWLRPMWIEHVQLTNSLDDKERMKKGRFGVNMRPAFTDMIHLKTLDERWLPQSGKDVGNHRLVIVGDVHGCKDERKLSLPLLGMELLFLNSYTQNSRRTPGRSLLQTPLRPPNPSRRHNSQRSRLTRRSRPSAPNGCFLRTR